MEVKLYEDDVKPECLAKFRNVHAIRPKHLNDRALRVLNMSGRAVFYWNGGYSAVHPDKGDKSGLGSRFTIFLWQLLAAIAIDFEFKRRFKSVWT